MKSLYLVSSSLLCLVLYSFGQSQTCTTQTLPSDNTTVNCGSSVLFTGITAPAFYSHLVRVVVSKTLNAFGHEPSYSDLIVGGTNCTGSTGIVQIGCTIPNSYTGTAYWWIYCPDGSGGCNMIPTACNATTHYTLTITCCLTPGNLTCGTITESSIMVNWSTSAGASSYEIQYRQVGTSSWTGFSTAGTSYTFNGLPSNTQYEFQVRANCNGPYSNWSPSTFCTTLSLQCVTPTNLYCGTITTNSIIVNWSTSAGASSYEIQYRQVGTATWIGFSTPSTSYTFNGLPSNTQYEFQVRANCNGPYSNWSNSIFCSTYNNPDNCIIWHTIPNLPGNRTSSRAEAHNGLIYCMGGFDGTAAKSTLFVFDGAHWQTNYQPMAEPRYEFSSGILDNKLYVLGGMTSSTTVTSQIEYFDFSSLTWNSANTTIGGNNITLHDMDDAVIGESLFIFGGITNYSDPSNCNAPNQFIYDHHLRIFTPSLLPSQWTDLGVITAFSDRSGYKSVALNGKLFIIGGAFAPCSNPPSNYPTYFASVWMYDPNSQQWSLKDSMNVARADFACGVSNGKIYVAGGINKQGTAANSVEYYDILTDTWTLCTENSFSVVSPSSTVDNDSFYILGGTPEFGASTCYGNTIKKLVFTITSLNGNIIAPNSYDNISVCVTDQDGQPVSNLPILIHDPNETSNTGTTLTTDLTGCFLYPIIPQQYMGQYTYSFTYGDQIENFVLGVDDNAVPQSGQYLYYQQNNTLLHALGHIKFTEAEFNQVILTAAEETFTSYGVLLPLLGCAGMTTITAIAGLVTAEAGGVGALPLIDGTLEVCGAAAEPLFQTFVINAMHTYADICIDSDPTTTPEQKAKDHAYVDNITSLVNVILISQGFIEVSGDLGTLIDKVFTGRASSPTLQFQNFGNTISDLADVASNSHNSKVTGNRKCYPNALYYENNITLPLPNLPTNSLLSGTSSYINAWAIIFPDSVLLTISDTSLCAVYDTLSIVYKGLDIDSVNYMFDFDSGVIHSGSRAGPFKVTWSTPGVKNITFWYVDGGIASMPVVKRVLVYPIDSIKLVNVVITASSNPFCPGSSVTFTATPINGGSDPVYQWKVNGTNAGTNSSTFTYFPANNDSVRCVITSNMRCITGNPAASAKIIMSGTLAPIVSFTSCFDTITTVNAQPIRFKGGIPLGGTFTGPGVISLTGIFLPSIAGIGTQTITYTYTNAAMCSANKSIHIIVQATPMFSCENDFVDIRDNTVYPTVQIGSQCWMASNLNYGIILQSSQNQRDNCVAEKYCYDDTPSNCTNIGGLYQWDELMLYDDNFSNQGFCPPGWHIPTENEWNNLFSNWINNGFAGSHLKFLGSSGFNAQMAGTRHDDKSWDYQGFATFFWSSTSQSKTKAWAHGMNNIDPSVSLYPSSRSNAFSIRCLQDNWSLETLPIVTTTAVTNNILPTAISGGNVTSDGGTPVIARGVCWSTSPNPTIADNLTIDGIGTGKFISNLTGLAEGKLYYVRAYAINSVGIAYGNEISFSPYICYFSDNFNDGNFTNNPHWDFFPGGTGCHVTGTADVVNDHFHEIKTNAPGCGTATQIEHSFNLLVTDSTKITFDINPVFSDVGNGAGWTNEEYPAYVDLRLWNANNDSTDVRFCYNYRGGVSHTDGTYIFVVFPYVAQNVWLIGQQFRFRDYVPDAIRCSKILIGGNGWDYEGLFDNINIICQ